jgi:hypothetical protein
MFSLLSASGKRYCWHSDLNLILGTFLKTTSTISIPLYPTDLTQHWTRPCKLPGARFGIGLLLQIGLLDLELDYCREYKVLPASFFPDCSFPHPRCVWRCPNTFWCCPSKYRHQNVHNRNQSVSGHHSSFLKNRLQTDKEKKKHAILFVL